MKPPMFKFVAELAAVAIGIFAQTGTAWSVEIDSPPASNLAEARTQHYLNVSDEAIILSYIRKYHEPVTRWGSGCRLQSSSVWEWSGGEKEPIADYIATAGAVLYVVANYTYFRAKYPAVVDQLLELCGGDSANNSVPQQIGNIRRYIHGRLRADIYCVARPMAEIPPSRCTFRGT